MENQAQQDQQDQAQDLLDQAQALATGDLKPKLSMADTLRKHRAGYEATKASSGKHSLHNGDEIAKLLAGLSPQVALAAAQAVADHLGTEIDLLTKYKALNKGQVRMCSGNRVRGALKRGDVSIEEVVAFVEAAQTS